MATKYGVFKVKEGTPSKKFFNAGVHYVSKVPNIKRDKLTLVAYIKANFEEVCNEGCSKGYCTRRCKSCPVQGAYEAGLVRIAIQPEYEKAPTTKEIPPYQRYGMTWEEFKAKNKNF